MLIKLLTMHVYVGDIPSLHPVEHKVGIFFIHVSQIKF